MLNLVRAVFVARTVVLVNDYWVLYVVHNATLETDVLSESITGLAHDFILTPFSVPVNVAVFTVTFCTPASTLSFPKLPMLVYNKDNCQKEN